MFFINFFYVFDSVQVIPETHPNGVGENGDRKIALDGTDEVIKAARQEIQRVIDVRS